MWARYNRITTHVLDVGVLVTVPRDFCPGCGCHVGPLSGRIVGYQGGSFTEEEPPRPGPLYAVEVSHEHNRKVAQGFVDGRRVAMVDFVH